MSESACQVCAGTDLVEVSVLSLAGPIRMVCISCGANDRPGQPVAFTRWRGRELHVMQSGGVAVTVWCGPAASEPQPPTPGEILAAAGLGHLVLL